MRYTRQAVWMCTVALVAACVAADDRQTGELATEARCSGTGCPIEDGDDQPTNVEIDPTSTEALPAMIPLPRDNAHPDVRCERIYEYRNTLTTVKAIECCTGDQIDQALSPGAEATGVFAIFYCCAVSVSTGAIRCGLGRQSNQV